MRIVRVGAVLLLVSTVLYRALLNGPMLRVFVANRQASGGASTDFIDGLAVMAAYWTATEWYGTGVVILLVVLVFFGHPGGQRATPE